MSEFEPTPGGSQLDITNEHEAELKYWAAIDFLKAILTPDTPDWTGAACRPKDSASEEHGYEGNGSAQAGTQEWRYDIFFPKRGDMTTGPAKKICEGCKIKEPCADFATNTKNADRLFGVWGGLPADARKKTRRAQKVATEPPAPPTFNTVRPVTQLEAELLEKSTLSSGQVLTPRQKELLPTLLRTALEKEYFTTKDLIFVPGSFVSPHAQEVAVTRLLRKLQDDGLFCSWGGQKHKRYALVKKQGADRSSATPPVAADTAPVIAVSEESKTKEAGQVIDGHYVPNADELAELDKLFPISESL